MTRLVHLTTVDMSLELLLGPQLRAARDAGYEVVGVSAPGPWVVGLEADGIGHVPLSSSTRGWNLLADLRAVIDFWQILRRDRPDILHTHNPKPGLYGRVLGRLGGVPIVINTLHGLYATPDDPVLKRAIFYLAEAFAARFSDYELIQSAEDVALIRRLHLAHRGRFEHLGNGIDLEHFSPEGVRSEAISSLRAELKLPPGSPVIGVVGRLVAEKGLPELFSALRELRSAGEDFTALVIGPTDVDKADAISQAEIERAEADGVRFLGLRHNMRELYALMDLFVLASHREGFPRAAMEAAAMGIPIVATNIRGCREVVEDGRNGLLVPIRDHKAMTGAIAGLLKDRERREAMGRHGRKLALERFDVRNVTAVVLDTYRRVAEEKGISLLVETGCPEPAVPRDAPAIAALHVAAIRSGFLSSLGSAFLTQIYRGLIDDPDGVVLVIRNKERNVAGFVAGAANTISSYGRMMRRRALSLGLAALPALISRPRLIRRAVETLRYPSVASTDLPEAELLAMAVAAEFQSQGFGAELVSEFIGRMAAPAVRVVVGSTNEGARRFYRAQGFTAVQQTEVHAGQPSEVLVWRSPSA